MTDKTTPEQANTLINELGGTCAVAGICEIRPPSVSHWRKTGIPKPWVKYFGALKEIKNLQDVLIDARTAHVLRTWDDNVLDKIDSALGADHDE